MPSDATQLGQTLSTLLTIAWLLPLAGFAIEIFGGFWGTRQSKAAAYIAVACIGTAFLCSVGALLYWGDQTDWAALQPHHGSGHGEAGQAEGDARAAAEHAAAHPSHAGEEVDVADHAQPVSGAGIPAGAWEHNLANAPEHAAPKSFSGTFYVLAGFGSLRVAIDWYIDSLTLVMFTMVTLVASLIHLFAIGYMSDELTDDHEDHQVQTAHGHLHRPGRFSRFFAFLSLFSFSMLGLVLAGNVFMVFVFWELVGVCSYFLIGFYVERKSASNAANKAFIMNRVGDFGFLIGLMILWTYFGTFQFANRVEDGVVMPGLFDMLRDGDGNMHLSDSGATVLLDDGSDAAAGIHEAPTIPYFLLVAAGLGIFAGCVGKSAQFPLQTWLPDAMEGPTPVSALVHSATMVAAGVYLTGRFYPMFTPEVLLTIAYIGCITLFLAATIAVVATDIKRVLAYSTISQLGYMMLGLGVGGWGAGLFHLITHAFFKSLMFLASGSVIYGCHHVQEMPRMGGLWRKMPITAFTMLVGVIAIAGLAIPGISIFGEKIAFSGYHSKDAIVATAMTFADLNRTHFLLFYAPLIGAGITSFYMFRLWFLTFAGKPRDQHVYDHAHESPRVMTVPLIVLSMFAAFVAVGGEEGKLFLLLTNSEPAGVANGLVASSPSNLALPSHEAVHARHALAGTFALVVAALGALVACVFYGLRLVNPAEVQRQFASLHTFLIEKWWFDELYDMMFVRPVHVVAKWCSACDKYVFDGILHGLAKGTVLVAHWDRMFDEQIVDGLVNWVGRVTYGTGSLLRLLQTGRLRQYVMFIVVGVVGIWVIVQIFAS
ncbi:MAG: NADH-quinone oxidoreductase subunit L [Planctomycetaceae bacterium]|nr:NADH-quinone oxidoreductase subunit L [Planctomycetaceae bacterium]